MESTNDYNESDAHEPLKYPLPIPPTCLSHQQKGLSNPPEEKVRVSRKSRGGWDWNTLSSKGKREAFADELSSSLATIAREERRKVGYLKEYGTVRSVRQNKGESDESGDASEESWFRSPFLDTPSVGVPVVTYSTPSNLNGLPMPLDATARQNHGNSHAVVVASLPPPLAKGRSGSSTSIHSHSSCSAKGRSGDEKLHADEHESSRHVKHARSVTSTVDIRTKGDHAMHTLAPKAKRLRISLNALEWDGEGSSSESATEGGYDASVSSPSVSSEDERDGDRRKTGHAQRNERRRKSEGCTGSVSSELADFNSLSSQMPQVFSSEKADGMKAVTMETKGRKQSHHATYEQSHVVPSCQERGPVIPSPASKIQRATHRRYQDLHHLSLLRDNYESALVQRAGAEQKPAATHKKRSAEAPIFSLGCDMMAHCMTFLEPLEVYSLLTMPLSKQWRNEFTASSNLWRVLCLMEPFKAKYGPKDVDSTDDESASSFPSQKHVFGKYRLLYTSFIRCLRYLNQIKDDAVHGRPPSVLDYGGDGLSNSLLTSNSGLREFLAKARRALNKKKHQSIAAAAASKSESSIRSKTPSCMGAAHVGVCDDARSLESGPMLKKSKSESASTGNRGQYGHSQLTQRLLGPSMDGNPGNANLPWSCAIYSIVNWTVAFSDVEGIQTMCLKVLPYLLEDEGQRTTAQRAGLTDVVLRAMVVFPDSVELHTAAFHTIVLLARPIGGREGMLFHSSMVNSSGIFNDGSQSSRNGIAVMIDSMQRFEKEDILQAMSCWSLVNIALAPSQKSMLVKLGGIAAIANAMVQHPYNAEVQFRALFALINLVIPSGGQSDDSSEARGLQDQLGDVNQTVEKDIIDESVGQIANLVVQAMKHFCSSESILDRACLVLHNLSLTAEYHITLLWTPCCYQMLEWCLANYRTDLVLQQSAAGTLHRLQQTLSNDAELQHQFASFLQSQQQQSLGQAHEEAVLLHRRQENLLSRRSDA